MKQTKDEGYIIRCTAQQDGTVSYLRVSTGRRHLLGMFGPCFHTQKEAQKEIKSFKKSIATTHDMDVVKVTVTVEEV